MKADDLRDFLKQKQVNFSEDQIQTGMRFAVPMGNLLLYNTDHRLIAPDHYDDLTRKVLGGFCDAIGCALMRR